jgi:hypothetical protein
MRNASEFEEYQNALLELFLSGLPHDEILATLRSDPRFEPYKEYVNQFDPDMVDVAVELMSKWAKRK